MSKEKKPKPRRLPPVLAREFLRAIEKANQTVFDARVCMGIPEDWVFDQNTMQYMPPPGKEPK